MMLGLIGLAALAMAAQDPGQWQDFGAGPDGTRVSLNLDSVESGADGPEAMVRVRYARPMAGRAIQADIRSVFDCSGRNVRRFLMGQLSASGEIVARTDEGERMEPVRAPAGTPLGQVLDLVCEMAAG
jgi:hypothetical protein